MNSQTKYMCRLFETIRIENGQPQHLRWHEERMRKSGLGVRDWGLGVGDSGLIPSNSFSLRYGTRHWLESLLQLPANMKEGIVKCNVVYEKDILEISYLQYLKRPVRSLKLVYADAIDYHLKYADRTALDALFALKGDCDDIIIVKDGLITDSSISNLVFYDGIRWCTPEHPLLEGTCRARLIAGGQIEPVSIRPEDLNKYCGCKLINAMREMGEEEVVNIEHCHS
ncbi:MAG: aminotransferase class IV [Bacteroidetes bacterium]|nr:aminotransferase class IV [Bacteroidota bacterium]